MHVGIGNVCTKQPCKPYQVNNIKLLSLALITTVVNNKKLTPESLEVIITKIIERFKQPKLMRCNNRE